MPQTLLCFVWHMHQPFYKDLANNTYQLPWTRLHALKDYYGMVQLLEEFPHIHQTFNLVPSMMAQVAEYAAGQAVDPFLQVALKPAEDLNPDEQAFALRYLFQCAPRLLYRFERFGELHDRFLAFDRSPERARREFSIQDWRDLQVLSQLAWFDEDYLSKGEARTLAVKGRLFTRDEQVRMGRLQLELLSRVIPAYRRFARHGQIELSVTPYYHPILPLLCDSDIARVAMPGATLPSRFSYPQDAELQLRRSLDYLQDHAEITPVGLWPSEGSVSDETLRIAAGLGYQWAATDNGVLGRTLQRNAGWDETYRPYVWRQDGREIRLLFRDHFLSDLIGFNYANWNAEDAANHFLDRIREGSRAIVAGGRDALVPVILDGENCWEYYDQNGRPFLRTLYRKITEDARLEAVTVSEALQRVEATPLDRIHPGSWISADYHVWIGHEEDNEGWERLREAREAYEQHQAEASEDARQLAFEAIQIAEGSDWFWWYGPEHKSDNKPEFDQLFRDQLATVYRALGLPVPDALGRPILREVQRSGLVDAFAAIVPRLDGRLTAAHEWHGAGGCMADTRAGAMHGQRDLLTAMWFGSDGREMVYVRFDFSAAAEAHDTDWEIELQVHEHPITIRHQDHWLCVSDPSCPAAMDSVLEVAVPFSRVGLRNWDLLRLRATVRQQGRVTASFPERGFCSFYL